MPLNLRFCPTFITSLKQLFRKYPKCQGEVLDVILQQKVAPGGDFYPGFNRHIIRKLRIGLPSYRLGKRSGARFVYLLLKEKALIIPIIIYKKGRLGKEKKVIKKIKATLPALLTELQERSCKEDYFEFLSP